MCMCVYVCTCKCHYMSILYTIPTHLAAKFLWSTQLASCTDTFPPMLSDHPLTPPHPGTPSWQLPHSPWRFVHHRLGQSISPCS